MSTYPVNYDSNYIGSNNMAEGIIDEINKYLNEYKTSLENKVQENSVLKQNLDMLKLQNERLQQMCQEKQSQIDRLTSDISNINLELQQKNSQYDLLFKENDKLRTNLTEITKLNNAYQEQLHNQSLSYDKLNSQMAQQSSQSHEQLKNLYNENQKMKQNIQYQESIKLQNTINEMQTKYKNVVDECRSYQNDINKLNEYINQTKSEHTQLLSQLTAYKDENSKLNSLILASQSKENSYVTSINTVKQQLQSVQTQYNTFKQQYASDIEQIKRKQESEFGSQINSLKLEISRYKDIITEKNNIIESYKANIETSEAKIKNYIHRTFQTSNQSQTAPIPSSSYIPPTSTEFGSAPLYIPHSMSASPMPYTYTGTTTSTQTTNTQNNTPFINMYSSHPLHNLRGTI